MDSTELKKRTQKFAIDVIKLASKLPHNDVGVIFRRQIVRSGTSVGANYRAALRGKSKPDFINKIAIVLEELDETQYWLEIIALADLLKTEEANKIWEEAEQLMKIFTTTSKTAKANG
jgi:four helix bundle protein